MSKCRAMFVCLRGWSYAVGASRWHPFGAFLNIFAGILRANGSIKIAPSLMLPRAQLVRSMRRAEAERLERMVRGDRGLGRGVNLPDALARALARASAGT